MLNVTSIAMPVRLSMAQKSARNLVFKCLYYLDVGSLTIVESFSEQTSRQQQFGDKKLGEPQGVIWVKHPDFYLRLLKGGSIAAGEAYMDGWWDSPNLAALMELMAGNIHALDRIERRGSWLTQWAYKLGHWFKRNSIEQAKENIGAHYDLGNELYKTFLDKRMLYSSAIYSSANDSLEQAQLNKMQRLCQQLDLKQSDHVIEIGTGWGAMAIYMAQTYGCRVTTTTISEEQYCYAKDQIERFNLCDRVTLLKQDYRLLKGQYDKLVSIEMIEAVGKQYLKSYIKKCQSLLKPKGIMVIQAITIADQRYDHYSNSVDFIQKYIFPGGFLPSVTVLTQTATQFSDFIVRDLFDLGLDYAQTLKDWRLRFERSQEQVSKLGYDQRFIRMWRYYFCYCEGGFNARAISTIHMTLQRG